MAVTLAASLVLEAGTTPQTRKVSDMNTIEANNERELSDAELDGVAGGFFFLNLLGFSLMRYLPLGSGPSPSSDNSSASMHWEDGSE